MEIKEENGRCTRRYDTGDSTGSIDEPEITQEDADRIKKAYAPLEGKDIVYSKEGRKASKAAFLLLQRLFCNIKTSKIIQINK